MHRSCAHCATALPASSIRCQGCGTPHGHIVKRPAGGTGPRLVWVATTSDQDKR